MAAVTRGRLRRLAGAVALLVVAGNVRSEAEDLHLGAGAARPPIRHAVAPAPPSPPSTAPAVPLPTPVTPPVHVYRPDPYRVVGWIEIPKIGLRAPIGEGITLTIIDRGPSHWPGTAMPGRPGNVVIAGHRVTHTHPFRHIDRLVAGDRVVFEVGGTRTTYVMTGSEVVRPSRVDIVRQAPAATATLFACHPPGSARYRYVVHLALQR